MSVYFLYDYSVLVFTKFQLFLGYFMFILVSCQIMKLTWGHL